MQQEDHEPDTLERLLEEWVGREEEAPENKAELENQNSRCQEKEQQKDKKHRQRSRLHQKQEEHESNAIKNN